MLLVMPLVTAKLAPSPIFAFAFPEVCGSECNDSPLEKIGEPMIDVIAVTVPPVTLTLVTSTLVCSDPSVDEILDAVIKPGNVAGIGMRMTSESAVVEWRGTPELVVTSLSNDKALIPLTEVLGLGLLSFISVGFPDMMVLCD